MSSKKKDRLKVALTLEKKALATYKKLETEAKQRNALDLAKLFDDLGRENNDRIERIEELQRKMEREKRELEE
nr:hypothetical protein [Candidatus Freyarchaeota archaeon]